MNEIRREYEVTIDTFIEMLAHSWNYATHVTTLEESQKHQCKVTFSRSNNLFIAEYVIDVTLWKKIKPQVIKKAETIK